MDAVIRWIEHPMEQDGTKLEAALRDGDPEVLDRLIAQYQHRLFRYLLSLSGDRAIAEDTFQETWLRVLERGYQYRSQWKFEVWLFSIARNLVIDTARRKKMESLDELMNSDEGTGFQPPTTGPSPFESFAASEASVKMAQHVAKIPPVYREVLTLRFHEDLALEEMAAIVKAPVSTVKSRLYRGLDALRKHIEGAEV